MPGRLGRLARALLSPSLRSSCRGVSRGELRPLLEALWFGAAGGDPHPLFDAAFYVASHPEVASTGLGPLVHFLRVGAAERRDPHPLFDTAFYLERYPDVGRAGLNPLVHFLRFGGPEARDPHPLFSSGHYLERNPDAARSGLNPLAHYVRFGAAEGRDPHPLFDSAFYRDRHPEVARSGLDPLVHFLRMGAAEWRDPHPLFNTGYYLDRNPDVARAGLNPLVHYVQSGALEGRKPHPLFDGAWYLERCPQAREAGQNPLVHYLERGAAEGLDPHPLFDTSLYRERHPEVAAAGQNPLVHFVRSAGAPPGRAAVAEPTGPRSEARRAVVAILSSFASRESDDPSTSPAVAALRLFLASGWRVRLWSRSWPGASDRSFGILQSLGIEAARPEVCPSAARLLASTPVVDAVLLDDATDEATLAQVLAIHPQARLLYLSPDAAEGSDAETAAALARFDGVLSLGGRSGSLSGQRPFHELLQRAGVRPTAALSDRLESAARESAQHATTDADLVVFGLIPWRYRYQRPQHLAAEIGRRRCRVFFVNPDFLPGIEPRAYLIAESPADNVYSLQLRIPGAADIHRGPPGPAHADALRAGLESLGRAVALRSPVLIVEAPFWLPVVRGLQRSSLVYDCMDRYRAFPNVAPSLAPVEKDLLELADLVVFSSSPLQEQTPGPRRSVVIRNGCEYERFATAEPVRTGNRPAVGYVGAIDRWLDADLVRHCAEARPDWDFVLVGSTAGLPQEALPPRANLRFLGEVDYGEVAGLVAGFDVCVVPFLDNELTRCVNPVKVYEYLAAGKPVVASALPELVSLEPGLVHIGRSREEFLGRLDAAMGERSDSALASRRRAWAAGQTWTARAGELLRALRP